MDPRSDLLRVALADMTALDVAGIVSEARAQARERVRAILVDAITDAMLDQVQGELMSADGALEGRLLAGLDQGVQRAQEAAAEERADAPAPADVRADAPATAQARHHGTVAHQSGSEARVPGSEEELGWYVYGVIDAEAVLPRIPGVTIKTLREGRVAAIATEVPLSEFGEAELRSHLADMDWVERTARAHEAVLDEVRRAATVIPMRMCSVYRTEGGVTEMLRREAQPLGEALEHLEGKAEWGVKVFADPSHSQPPEEPESAADADELSGAGYMERKLRERDHAERAAQSIEEACGEIHAALCAVASDALLAPPHRPELSGHRGQMVLNGVYLVEDEARDAFHEKVEALQEEVSRLGLELVETGPWPAYNFVPGTIGAAW